MESQGHEWRGFHCHRYQGPGRNRLVWPAIQQNTIRFLENRQQLMIFCIFPAHGKIGPRWPQMGPGGFFPTNHLADILGDTDLDFENFYFFDFLGSQISGLGPAWARLGPRLRPGLGPATARQGSAGFSRAPALWSEQPRAGFWQTFIFCGWGTSCENREWQ